MARRTGGRAPYGLLTFVTEFDRTLVYQAADHLVREHEFTRVGRELTPGMERLVATTGGRITVAANDVVVSLDVVEDEVQASYVLNETPYDAKPRPYVQMRRLILDGSPRDDQPRELAMAMLAYIQEIERERNFHVNRLKTEARTRTMELALPLLPRHRWMSRKNQVYADTFDTLEGRSLCFTSGVSDMLHRRRREHPLIDKVQSLEVLADALEITRAVLGVENDDFTVLYDKALELGLCEPPPEE